MISCTSHAMQKAEQAQGVGCKTLQAQRYPRYLRRPYPSYGSCLKSRMLAQANISIAKAKPLGTPKRENPPAAAAKPTQPAPCTELAPRTMSQGAPGTTLVWVNDINVLTSATEQVGYPHQKLGRWPSPHTAFLLAPPMISAGVCPGFPTLGVLLPFFSSWFESSNSWVSHSFRGVAKHPCRFITRSRGSPEGS